VRLRARLFASVAAVVAFTVALVTWSVSVSARQAFEAVDAERTAGLIAQFRREFAREKEEIASRVDATAASNEFQRVAIEIGNATDQGAFVNVAAPLAAAQRLDVLDVVSHTGTIISSAHWPARFGYRHPWVTLQALSSGSAAFLQPVESPNGTSLAMIAVRQVPSGGGTIYLAGGRRLDQEFLKSLELPAGMRALLYRNAGPDVSGKPLIDAAGEVGQTMPFEPLIARVRESRADASEAIVLPGGREVVHGIPLQGRDDAIVGVLLVGSSRRELDSLLQQIYVSGFGLGALGILVGGVLSYAVATRVTRPVEQLAEAARTVSAGDWEAQIDVPATGEIAELAHAFNDMTRQLVDQRERLVQVERVAAWRELARRLAHELKNPLFPLRLTIDNLQRAKAEHPQAFDEMFDESIGTLRTGVSNLNTVIGRFSDFAKMPTPVFEQVSPNDVVRQALQIFQAQLQAPGRPPIAVALELDADVGTVPLDAEQLGRALQNLLLNAIDAMPDGGTITLRTRRAGGDVRFEIADTGQGLMDEERERLFTPYYTTKQHGTGLGLAIVQSVVADHGGRIRVESRRGRGTTFHIELPAKGGARR
jgi:two-component system, NtrC family, nitrogen regulation sensor histidine kinase NtrY